MRYSLSVFSEQMAYTYVSRRPRDLAVATNTCWGLTSSDKELLPVEIRLITLAQVAALHKERGKPTKSQTHHVLSEANNCFSQLPRLIARDFNFTGGPAGMCNKFVRCAWDC